MPSPWTVSLLSLTLVGCGARTGLNVYAPPADAPADLPTDVLSDTGFDVEVDAVAPIDVTLPDLPPVDRVCVPMIYSLPRNQSQAMILLDESQSMSWDIHGDVSGVPSRWSVVRTALGESLPRYDGRVNFGLWTFPSSAAAGSCGAPMAPTIVPARGTSSAILRHMDTNAPAGRTPTRAALSAIGLYLAAQTGFDRLRSIVLITDGAPNCNGALNPSTCVCSVSTGCSQAELCLDDRATIDQLTALARTGVATYVLGIDGDREPALVDVLNRMAVAGGRPRSAADGTRYFSIQRSSDLSTAFDTIRPDVADCDRVTPFRWRDGEVRVDLDGTPIARDTTHTDGWDWVDDVRPVLRLAGGACRRSTEGVGLVTLRAGCN